MMKHLCSSISYGGADSLADLRARFDADPMRYVIRLSWRDVVSRTNGRATPAQPLGPAVSLVLVSCH